MNLVWFKNSKFAPTQASLFDFNVANFESTTLEHVAGNLNDLTGSPGRVGRRGLQVDVGHRPRTATPPRGLEGRPSVALPSHWAALRGLPDETFRAGSRVWRLFRRMPKRGVR